MRIAIDLSSKEPPYEQIRTSIARLIRRGDLRPETKLPTIRQLAGDLGVANNTVARAYRELETGGFILSSGRRGTVVANADTRADQRKVQREVDALVARARHQGVDPTTLLGMVAQSLAAR